MFRFGSKKELNTDLFKCTIRLLDDNEVLECEFNVRLFDFKLFMMLIGY